MMDIDSYYGCSTRHDINWFLTTHAQVLRKGRKLGFEVLMLMSVAQVFGLYTPKEVANYLEIRYQAL